jgi:hypothetical protein
VLKFQFVMGPGLSSRLIAWFSAGPFSHVDCVMPSGDLLGARSDDVGGGSGVRTRPSDYEKWRKTVTLKLPVRPAQERRFYDFLNVQIGKPYDKTAILGFVAGRDWREQDSWFCSELQAAALESAGICPTLYAPASKITPAALATVLSALGATVA